MGLATTSRAIRAVNVGHKTAEANNDDSHDPPRKPLYRLHPAQADRQPRSQPSRHPDQNLTYDYESAAVSPKPENLASKTQNRLGVVGMSLCFLQLMSSPLHAPD